MPRFPLAVLSLGLAAATVHAQQNPPLTLQTLPQASTTHPIAPAAPPDPLFLGKQALAHSDYATAQTFFTNYLKDNSVSVEALFYAGNAALGLKQYDEAARRFDTAIAIDPTLWAAHKNLVIIDAAQGKWQDFDRERKLLAAARASNAPNLSKIDPDVIEVIYLDSERYVVRAFPQLAGRFKVRYNFVHFGKDSKADFWIACESDDVDQAAFAQKHPKEAAAGERSFSMDSYTVAPAGSTHGTIKFYPDGEPTYDTVRADAIKILEHKTGPLSTTTVPSAPKTATPKAEPPAPK